MSKVGVLTLVRRSLLLVPESLDARMIGGAPGGAGAGVAAGAVIRGGRACGESGAIVSTVTFIGGDGSDSEPPAGVSRAVKAYVPSGTVLVPFVVIVTLLPEAVPDDSSTPSK